MNKYRVSLRHIYKPEKWYRKTVFAEDEVHALVQVFKKDFKLYCVRRIAITPEEQDRLEKAGK